MQTAYYSSVQPKTSINNTNQTVTANANSQFLPQQVSVTQVFEAEGRFQFQGYNTGFIDDPFKM